MVGKFVRMILGIRSSLPPEGAKRRSEFIPLSQAAAAQRDLNDAASLDLLVELVPSNMVAGPCPASLALAGKRVRPEGVPLIPLQDCIHPDQCACFYQSRLGQDGEF